MSAYQTLIPLNFLAVGLGAALGAWARWLAGLWLNIESWPWGTLAVNLVGGYLIGLLLALVTVAAAGLLQYPYVLLLILIVVYLAHIPFAWRSQRWVAARFVGCAGRCMQLCNKIMGTLLRRAHPIHQVHRLRERRLPHYRRIPCLPSPAGSR